MGCATPPRTDSHQRKFNDPCDNMFSSPSGIVITGGTFNNIHQAKRGIDILLEFVATDALHDSKELYDAPKCHPHTRVAVLADIMEWVTDSCEAQDEFIMWLFGPAGAGKSAIAKKIAELVAEKELLIGSFFFSRTSPTRSTQDRLIATLAYQMAVSIPETRNHIEDAIERDPAILYKNIQTQIDILLIKPFQSASIQITPFSKLIIIDGLDECSDSKAQVAILGAVSRALTKQKLPIKCLFVSRPETDLVSSFNSKEPLKSLHRRLALDDTYHPDDDIHRFFSDKFEEIRGTHRLRATIPFPWPSGKSLDALVKKSSGQFIFAATVVRFVESNRHRPAERLNIVLEISPPGTVNPFAELDALYRQILSSVDDIKLTLHVLSLYTSSPYLAGWLDTYQISEQFLSLEEGDIDLALIGLSSIVAYDEPLASGKVKILHASFVDFLADKRRSDEFYIDMASARTDKFACRTLQFVKGPHGIRGGDFYLLNVGMSGGGWSLSNELRNEILNFDLDAFIAAVIKSPYSVRTSAIIRTFDIWISVISEKDLEDDNEQLLIHRYRDSFESRIQKYQSDWRLQLLLTLAIIMDYLPWSSKRVRRSRYLDILLEMDDDDLHLVDQDALDLRYYSESHTVFPVELSDITSRYVDGDRFASAALHCMHFLSNPPTYSQTDGNARPEKGITYAEWKSTCHMALLRLGELLERANTSPEVMKFMIDHDINATVQNNLPLIDIWRADAHILAFLSRGDVCVNWRIISVVRRALSATDTSGQSESTEEADWDTDNGSDTLSISEATT